MTDNQSSADALRTVTPTPISELSPELPELAARAIDGSVTITWPYSASKRLVAFVLADHDFRRRRNKGQVRVEFHGAAGRALDKARIASGDTVRLSLDGVEWQKQDGPQPGLSGEPLGWQLKVSRKLRLSLRRLEAVGDEFVEVEGDEPDEEPATPIPNEPSTPLLPELMSEAPDEQPAPQTPLMNVSTKRLASAAFDNLEEYVSPAFLKRAKVSYGSLFEGGIDALEEESADLKKKSRRKSRFSMPTAAWRYNSRSPSLEREEDPASDSGDEVPVPGFSFSAKKTAQSPPEPQEAMVDEASQMRSFDQGASVLLQASSTMQDTQKDHFAITQEAMALEAPASGSSGAPRESSAEPQQPSTEPIPTDWMTAPAGELPVPLISSGSLQSPSVPSFDFGLASGMHGHVAPEQHQLYVPVSSEFTHGFPTMPTTSMEGLPLSVDIQRHDPLPIESTFEHRPFHDNGLAQESEHEAKSSAHRLSHSPSPLPAAPQPATAFQSQPVETIEILSSSPAQSPRAAEADPIDSEIRDWTHQHTRGHGTDKGEDNELRHDDQDDDAEGSVYDISEHARDASHEPVIDEEDGSESGYEDENAEISMAEEVERTHDATPDDDAEVPGEDYDLRKYDDAHEDDEEGNVDRDSLLSTDGEGNVIPAGPGIMSPNSSDEEEEGAALDVDDEQAGDLAHVHDGADDYDDSEVEEEAEGLSNGEEYDEDEEAYESEEVEEGSDEEEDLEQAPKPQEPVFIDLLSDSEDEDEAPPKSSASSQVQAASKLSTDQTDNIPTQQEALAQPLAASETHVKEERGLPDDGEGTRSPQATPVADAAGQDVELMDVDTTDVAEVDALSDPSVANEAMPDEDEEPKDDVAQPAPADVVEEEEEVAMPSGSSTHDTTQPTAEDSREEVAAAILEPSTNDETMPDAMGTADTLPKENDAPPEKAVVDETESTRRVSPATEAPSQGKIPASQTDAAETTYYSQPPLSFDDLGMTQSDLLSQTVADSQTQPRISEPSPDSSHTAGISQTVPKDEPSTRTQQLMTPSETQEVEAPDETNLAATSEHEESPGPDDQLYLEMQQREPRGIAHRSQEREGQEGIVTEEDELALIEDEAEHDPSLAEKDLIITVDSLRSHDHKADDTAEANASNVQEQGATDIPMESEAQEKEASAKSPPKLRARVPQKTSHRKTRSQGSVDISTGQAAVPSSPVAPASEQPIEEEQVPDPAEAPKTPPRLRASRRKKAIPGLELDAADGPQRSTRMASKDSRGEVTAQELRTSPRAHRRGKASDAATEKEAPKSPSVTTSSQGAPNTSITKTQLLKTLQTDLPEFLSLKVLRNSLHKIVDILAVAVVSPAAPVRPKNGPRDYMLEIVLTDPSTAPSSVSVAQIYRPHQKSLPVVKAGDVVLLRRFQVLSMKGRGFGIRAGDDSAWAVFEKDDEERLPQIKGPPVEVTGEEVGYADGLAEWWAGVGDEGWKKAEAVGERAMAGPGDGK